MVGTNEQVLEMRRKPVPEEARMSEYDQAIIGKAIRVEIPFTDLYKMRAIAELLQGLATDLDFASRRTDHPTYGTKEYVAWRRTLLFYLRDRSLAVNRRIRELHGKHHKNGTTK